MFLLGYDCGTSSIKASLLDAESGKTIASATSPHKEMPIAAPQNGWAQQNPLDWWENVKLATKIIINDNNINPSDIKAIGIAYQMHGLVCVDKNLEVLTPSIIWCDSRAVEYGSKAAQIIGHQKCLENMLNLPGNFTAAKLAWVKDNQPQVYNKIYKIMLPGDYIAMKMTGHINTTISGLSEGIFWDFKNQNLSQDILNAFDIDVHLIPDIVPTFGEQGLLTSQTANELGLKSGTPITYRAGDQPNNAFSLNVLEPGEIATTAGTSGVVCGIGDRPDYDPKSRVNSFAHVNYTNKDQRLAVLMCVAGTGILNSWLKHNFAAGIDYPQMNDLAKKAPIGSDGLCILPFGNGAERILENQNPGASFHNINFNIHNLSHILRAAQEGIVFGLNYGLSIMKDMGIKVSKFKAGDANMFLSPIFRNAFATVLDAPVELYNTDGSQGAARAAGIGAKIYASPQQAFTGLTRTKTIEPDNTSRQQYIDAYESFLGILKNQAKP